MYKPSTLPQNSLAIILLSLALSLVGIVLSNHSYAQDDSNAPADAMKDKAMKDASMTDKGTMKNEKMAPAPRQMVDVKQQMNLRLSEEVEQEDLQWLSADGDPFLALWQPDKTGQPYGAVLILPGEGQSVEWPNSVSAIRKTLSLHGWATLAIDLPPARKDSIPKRPPPKAAMKDKMADKDGTMMDEKMDEKMADKSMMDSTMKDKAMMDSTMKNKAMKDATMKDKAMADTMMADKMMKDGDNPAMMKKESMMMQDKAMMKDGMMAMKDDIDPEQTAISRLKSAIRFLQEQGQFNIAIIGHGSGAVRAAKLIDMLDGSGASENKSNRQIRAFILVQARNQVPNSPEKLLDLVKIRDMPMLDIYYGDHYLDQAEAKKRKTMARTKNIKDYYQVKILRPNGDDADAENRLTRRVRGFLNKHAKGVEVERKR